MLTELKNGIPPEEVTRRADTGLPKLWIVYSALAVRNSHPEWFGPDAAYTPLEAAGPKAEHMVGYLRRASVAAIAPRWPMKLGDSWGGTSVELPHGRWKNVLTGDSVTGGRWRLQALLNRFPVALLTKESD
jgi:(1->4)-alpha-D-glucan 1-alpha-D-glucosylmutase